MKTTILLLALLLSGAAQAQVYQPVARKQDAFSVALVQLLNEATTRFANVQGDSLRSTWLMGTDYKLTIDVPGSTLGIVRVRDWDKNVYVEFRGFKKGSMKAYIKELLARMKAALGDQWYERNDLLQDPPFNYYGLYLRDANGYYQMNMEVFGSTSSANPYLLGPEREDDRQPKEEFVLLKIYSGTPSYYNFIRPVAVPDAKLQRTLQQVLKAAELDFDPLRMQPANPFKKQKRRDTLHQHGFTVYMDYRRGNYNARLLFPTDSAHFNARWAYYQQVVQAATGTNYVYYRMTDYPERSSILYFSKLYDTKKPKVYLERHPDYPNSIVIRIESPIGHPTSRGMTKEDFED